MEADIKLFVAVEFTLLTNRYARFALFSAVRAINAWLDIVILTQKLSDLSKESQQQMTIHA